MALIETKFRYQYRISSQLIKIIQQRYSPLIDHHEEIQIICLMRQLDNSSYFTPKIINSFFKRMPHDAITVCRPIKRIWGRYTTIRPTILIFNGNRSSFMGETSILHTSAIEIFIRLLFQFQCNHILFEHDRLHFFNHNLSVFQIDYLHQCRILIKHDLDSLRSHRQLSRLIL